MPTYEYECEKCDNIFEVIKSIHEYKNPDQCPVCGNIGRRLVSRNISFLGEKIEDAEYNPAFGCIVKGKRHRQELAKKHDVVEIGNDYKAPEEIHKTNDKILSEKRKKAWESV